jgi:predicted SPOUT superfamily RNA methylase MTH1
VVHPQKAAITIPVLRGQTEAYTDAPIYAQTSGYLKNWYFNIGAKVKRAMFLPRLTLPKSINSWRKRKRNSRRHRQRLT